ncbi:MAG: stage III sporulation protein AC [Clostridium sp.]
MLDVTLIFKIASLGIILIVLDKVLKSSGKDDIAVIANIAGIVVILIALIGVIKQLFDAVKTMFMF